MSPGTHLRILSHIESGRGSFGAHYFRLFEDMIHSAWWIVFCIAWDPALKCKQIAPFAYWMHAWRQPPFAASVCDIPDLLHGPDVFRGHLVLSFSFSKNKRSISSSSPGLHASNDDPIHRHQLPGPLLTNSGHSGASVSTACSEVICVLMIFISDPPFPFSALASNQTSVILSRPPPPIPSRRTLGPC